jgi:hypothetical protein
VRCGACDGLGAELEAVPDAKCRHCGRVLQWRHDLGKNHRWCPGCWVGYPPVCGQPCKTCQGSGGVPGPSPVLTPDVRRMAAAAYEERQGGWICARCGPVPDGEVYESEGGGHGHASKGGDCWMEVRRVEDGTLDPARLMVLSDALEEAGLQDAICAGADAGESASILRHLRSPGPHVRGCWAVDLILGKE